MLLLGAGASHPFGIPTMESFTGEVLSHLVAIDKDASILVRDIRDTLDRVGFKPDIEAILTVLAGMLDSRKALLDLGPRVVLFADRGDPRMRHERTIEILKKIEDIIYERCGKADFSAAFKLYGNLFNRLTGVNTPSRASRTTKTASADEKHMIRNIFTTNYDLAIEAYLRKRKIGFDEGFHEDNVGDFKFTGIWQDKVDVKLFKLHGSISYFTKEDGKIVRLSTKPERVNLYGEGIAERMMIYPVGKKYFQEPPYRECLTKLRNCISSETDCIAIGYSFRDSEINDVFEDNMRMNKNFRLFIVSPFATHIRDQFAVDLQDRIGPINNTFESPNMSSVLVYAVQNFRPTSWS